MGSALCARQAVNMKDELEQQDTVDIDLGRRRAMWRALGAAPVILTLSSTPAWASHYGYDQIPPPECEPPPDEGEDCRDPFP